jgi:hypothetical protein
MSFLNNLAYAVLGVPSVIFGMLLLNHRAPAQAAGGLLALNGIACIVGLVGVLFKLPWLNLGSLVGGVLFLLSLILLAMAFLESESGVRPALRLQPRLRLR